MNQLQRRDPWHAKKWLPDGPPIFPIRHFFDEDPYNSSFIHKSSLNLPVALSYSEIESDNIITASGSHTIRPSSSFYNIRGERREGRGERREGEGEERGEERVNKWLAKTLWNLARIAKEYLQNRSQLLVPLIAVPIVNTIYLKCKLWMPKLMGTFT